MITQILRVLLLFISFLIIMTYYAEGQVNEVSDGTVKICVPGAKDYKNVSVKKLDNPHIIDFKGLKKIIPGKSILSKTIGVSKIPFRQKVIGNPLVNNGLKTISAPKKIVLNYISEKIDSVYHSKGLVKRIKAKLPTIVEAREPMYKEDASINLKYLDLAQGLFSSYIMTVKTDGLGTIWMGTYDAGLVAYDGRTFYQYGTEQGLPSNQILSLHIDKKERIWIGTHNNGLVSFNGSDFHQYTVESGLPGNKVRAIEEDALGRIWVGTDNGITLIDNSTLYTYSKEQGLDVRQVYDITIGANDELWIGTFNSGLLMFDGISFFQYSMMQGLETSAIWAVNTDKNGHVWMGTFGEGIIEFDGNNFSQYIYDQGIETTEILNISKDSNNNLWFGTDGGGIIKYDGEAFTIISDEHGLTNNIINEIFEDQAGNYWIASHGGGLMKYDDGAIQYLTENQGLSHNIALSFADDKIGNMWIGSWGKGLMKFTGDKIELWNQSKGLNDNTIWDIEFDGNGDIWFGTENGVSKINNNLVISYNTDNGLIHNEVTSLLKYNKGMWIGTYQGLNFIRNDSIFCYDEEQGLQLKEIRSLFKDRHGNIWIGSNDNGLAVLSHNKFFHINNNHGITSNNVNDIFEDFWGNIWVATNDKINVLPSGIVENINKILARRDYQELSNDLYSQLDNNVKVIGMKQGLKSNMIRNFISLNKKDIWAGTGNGISKFRLDTSNSSSIRKLNIYGKNYYIENYGYQQGFIGGDVFSNHSVGIDKNNNIWWGTGKLITLMNEIENSDTLKPTIRITAVNLFYEPVNWLNNASGSPVNQLKSKMSFRSNPIIEYEGVLPWTFLPKKLILSHEINHITFNFTGINWKSSTDLNYSFMLEGYDESWNPPTKLHKSTYSNLSPGKYKFRIIASNKQGFQSKQDVFEFTILPPWWKTTWFRILAAILIVLLVYVIYQWRIAIFKRQKRELESIVKERTTEVTEKNEELLQQTEEILTQRNEIESQKNQLEKVHQDLMESIEYSHFIQNSMMPNTSLIKGLADQFLFFKPKERISGDFYWWTTFNSKIIATVADCTGHGVPGALMSMLGISFLREIIIKEKVEEPAIILNKLRHEIIAVLDQKMEKGVQKDGLDMALVCIDLNTLAAKFAGARNPLVLIRDGQIIEYTSDRAPISIYLKMKEFSQQEIQLKQNDQIYLFSDGYPDQFNGENGKKFKRSRFKDLLLSISHKPMHEQKQELISHFEKWKGNEEQIDDVTIVGFKI